MPLLALMLDRGRHRAATVRLGQMLFWLLAVLALPLGLEAFAQRAALPAEPAISLEDFRRNGLPANGNAIINLPAGTQVPVEFEISGDIFMNTGEKAVLPLTLARPIELLLQDGKLTGSNRFPGEPWQLARQARWVHIPWLKVELTPDRGPFVNSQLIIQLRQP